MPVKGTKEEVIKRIEIVAELLVKGLNRREILQYNAKIGWGLADRQVDTYISRARAEIKKTKSNKDLEYKINLHINRLEDVYKQSLSDKDYRNAVTALQEQNKMLGLYAAEKVDITTKEFTIINDIARTDELK